ncbi:MAG TPA: hypothetical protein VEI97_07760 [bacterium]|nr:hypothetical protein [bacterium]
MVLVDERNANYLNLLEGVIGRTVSTSEFPNTTSVFYFWLSKHAENVQLGNMVAAVDEKGTTTFGIVVSMQAILNVPSVVTDYLSHDFGIPEALPPTEPEEVTLVKCQIINNTTGRVQPIGRSEVYFASPTGIEHALGQDAYAGDDRGIPIGVFENGDGEMTPLLLDEAFLLGPEGAHLNVSGISGLATKTSVVEFILKSIFTYCAEQRGRKVAVIVFNVKGKDLLFFDKPNPALWEDSPLAVKSRKMYDLMQISPEPFHSVRVFAPYDSKAASRVKSLRMDGSVEPFVWSIAEVQDDINVLFDRSAWDDATEAVWVDIQAVIEKQGINDYDNLMVWLAEERRATHDIRHSNWHGHAKHIFHKAVKNLSTLPGFYDGLVAHGGAKPIDIPINELKNGEVWVIDIQSINERGQRLVFNKVLKKLEHLLSSRRGEVNLDNIIVFVDELNKFAPKHDTSGNTIKQGLIHLAARGRSLGVTLFGIEQFASEVDKQIVDNASTLMYGRTGFAELKDEIYGWLSDELKNRLSTAPRGELLLKHAKFTQPLFFKFPLPACVPGDLYIPGADEVLEGTREGDKAGAETAFARSEGREIDF